MTIPVEVPAAIDARCHRSGSSTPVPGAPTIDGKFAGIGIRKAGTTLELDVAGRGGVPADATGVVLNLTATDGTGIGYVTVWACGHARPIASSLNFKAGTPKPNAVLTAIGANGKVCIYTAEADAHLIADVNGLIPADGGYAPVMPARLLETRVGAPTVDGLAQGEGPRAAGSTYTLQVRRAWQRSGRRRRGVAQRDGHRLVGDRLHHGVELCRPAAVGVERQLRRRHRHRPTPCSRI